MSARKIGACMVVMPKDDYQRTASFQIFSAILFTAIVKTGIEITIFLTSLRKKYFGYSI